MNSQSMLVMIMLLLATENNSEILPITDCTTGCGNLSIPFPNGRSSCSYLDDAFLITCNHSYNLPKPFLNSGNTEFREISLDGRMKISSSIASDCYNDSGAQINVTISELTLPEFPIDKTQDSFACYTSALIERDGRKDGSGCHPKSRKTLFYIVSGLMVPAVGSFWIFRRHKQKKVVKLRKNLFKRNGGLILENMLSGQRTLQVFTAENLKRATSNYDDRYAFGTEYHFQTNYRGELPNQVNPTVTIKKYHAPDERHLEVFISKLVTLSQINHRNIVKLIGCCLETQLPLLVYEFIGAKTLYDYIHDDDLARSLTWDVRLKIAAETAGALAYMHSAAANGPLFHGHLTSSSILLHDGYSVKVDGFVLTCTDNYILPFHTDEIGYIDPEYFISGRQTIKSDVYSFGVVLAELLTRKTVFLAHDISDFVSLPRGHDLLLVLDHRLVVDGEIEQLTQVVKLAQRCLSSSSVNRPTMQEVVIALEYMIRSTTISPSSSQVPSAYRVVR